MSKPLVAAALLPLTVLALLPSPNTELLKAQALRELGRLGERPGRGLGPGLPLAVGDLEHVAARAPQLARRNSQRFAGANKSVSTPRPSRWTF